MHFLRQIKNMDKEDRVLRNKKARLLKSLRDAIRNCPDNPHIKRISKNCFVMSSRHLSSRDWTPEYYNFPKQYNAICRALRKRTLEQVVPFLKRIIREGVVKKVHIENWYGRNMRLTEKVNIHPLVAENIKKVLRSVPE
jgi:hypothetical protein